MPLVSVIIPGSFSYDAGSPDEQVRRTSFLFGSYSLYSKLGDPIGGDLSDVIRRRGHQPGAFCARSGNWFPGENLTTDGQGRKVGVPFKTDGPAYPNLPPWPTFITNE